MAMTYQFILNHLRMETENQVPNVGKVKLKGIDSIVRVTYTCTIVDELGHERKANGFADYNILDPRFKAFAKAVRQTVIKQVQQTNESKDKQSTTPIIKT